MKVPPPKKNLPIAITTPDAQTESVKNCYGTSAKSGDVAKLSANSKPRANCKKMYKKVIKRIPNIPCNIKWLKLIPNSSSFSPVKTYRDLIFDVASIPRMYASNLVRETCFDYQSRKLVQNLETWT